MLIVQRSYSLALPLLLGSYDDFKQTFPWHCRLYPEESQSAFLQLGEELKSRTLVSPISAANAPGRCLETAQVGRRRG
jgi:hypothetical protein